MDISNPTNALDEKVKILENELEQLNQMMASIMNNWLAKSLHILHPNPPFINDLKIMAEEELW